MKRYFDAVGMPRTFDFRFAVGSCSIAHSPGVLPYSSKSNKLFMSVSFMGAPAEGSFSARNFST